MRKVVVDTNIVVSGLLFGGLPGEIVQLWEKRVIVPICSRPIIDEYLKVFTYPKFQLTEREIETLLYEEILPYFEVVEQKLGKPFIPADPSDDKFLWCALSGNAEAVISGDVHLLSYPDPPVPILRVREFLDSLPQR